MESRCAPKRIEKFFGMIPLVVMDVPPAGVREEGTNHLASAFVSSCLRKVWEGVEAILLPCI
jgi:hypothetical protein